MSESLMHASLVSELQRIFEFLEPGAVRAILVDRPGTDSDSKPPQLGGFYPDVFKLGPFELVGEAKTFTDLCTLHSRTQISCFINYLRDQPKPGALFLAVPLVSWNYGKSVLKSLHAETATPYVRSYCVFNGFSQLYSKQLVDWKAELFAR